MEACTKLDFLNNEAVEAIIYSIRSEHGLFKMSTEQLAKVFLTKALCIDCLAEPFDVVRNTYITDSNKQGKEKDDVPTDADRFYAFILQRHFVLWQEPRTVLAEYYDKATQDLKEVSDRIVAINKDIEKYKKDESPTEKQIHLPVLNYYLGHTENAREEIIRFLTIEKEEFVLHKCSMHRSVNQHVVPYTYYAYPYIYDVFYPTMISNKFNYDDDDYKKIKDMYENKKDEFKRYLRAYIERIGAVAKIRRACNGNYFFNKQESFIEEALNVYETGSAIMFSSACFLIVEGLLHDLCLQIGIPEVDILGAGFQIKLDKIYAVIGVDINYPYYSFKFRLLRNQVVHGTANSEELKEIADLLLLDLVDMIKITKSKKILMNAKLNCLRYALQEQNEKRFSFLTGYLALDDVVLPAAYDVKEDNDKIIELLKTEDFWSYLDKLLASGFGDYIASGALLLKKIKNLRIAELDEKCRERFKNHGNIKVNFDRESYLDMLLQYPHWV